ncbi:hypothetical protein SLA2020_270950 [Shorea laevis]
MGGQNRPLVTAKPGCDQWLAARRMTQRLDLAMGCGQTRPLVWSDEALRGAMHGGALCGAWPTLSRPSVTNHDGFEDDVRQR